MCLPVCLSLSLVACLLFGVTTEAKIFSLKDAINYAVDHSPEVDEAKMTLSTATLLKKSAFAQFLPSLDFTTSDGLEQLHPPGPTDPYTSSLNLTLTENLYNNGQTITQYKQAKLTEEADHIGFDKNRDQICLSVAQQFYLYSLNAKLHQVRDQQLKILRHQLEVVTSQYRQGFKTRKDFLRMKSQVQTAEIALNDAQTTTATTLTELRRLLGLGLQDNPKDQLSFQAIEPNDQEPEVPRGHLVVENTFDYRILELNKKINDLNVNLVVRQYWPQVDLTLTGAYQNYNFFGPTTNPGSASFVPVNTPSGFVTGAEQYGWTALVTLSYNVWDWGIKKRAVEIAENARSFSNDQFQDTLLTTEKNIGNIDLDLGRLEKEFLLQKNLVVADQETYDLLETDYREGKIAYLDLITSLSDLLDAKISYYTAYFDLLSDVAQFYFHQGNLYEKILSH